MSVTKVGRNEPCPCGSGRKYKKCCIDKKFAWVRGEDGSISRQVPMNEEMREILAIQRQKWIEKHGSPPGPDDNVFFDMDPPELVEHKVVQALESAQVRPALIYAYKKTGLIVTESNLELIPTADLDEYQAAVNEWYEIYGEDGEE